MGGGSGGGVRGPAEGPKQQWQYGVVVVVQGPQGQLGGSRGREVYKFEGKGRWKLVGTVYMEEVKQVLLPKCAEAYLLACMDFTAADLACTLWRLIMKSRCHFLP